MHAYQETVKANLNSNGYKRMRLLRINTIKQTALEQQSNVSGWLWTFWYDAFAYDMTLLQSPKAIFVCGHCAGQL